MSPLELGVEALAEAVRRGEISPDEPARLCHARARSRQPLGNAFAALLPEAPGGRATGPLAGVPYATKANVAARGLPLSCGSRLLQDYVPPYDATVTRRLKEAGAVLLGATNMDEFAMGSSCEHSVHGATRNPWDRTRTPGGSSGGAAAAVADGLVPFALGSDTGGSVRLPAAFCGVVGLKPTWGRVSRYGLVAFASSLDQIGPIARTVRDAAVVYASLAGEDPRDATSSTRPVEDPLEGIEEGPRGLRIGIPWHLLAEGLDAEVGEELRRVAAGLEAEGAGLVEVELPHAESATAAYYVVANAEASSNLARFDGVAYGRRVDDAELESMVARTRSEGFGAEVKRRILLGTFVLSAGYREAFYLRASRARTRLTADHRAAFERCDALLLPTAPTTAFRLGERLDDPLRMYRSDVFTTGANLTGLPAVAVPTGLDGEGLPLSVQLIGRPFDERGLLRAARAVERLAGFDARRPPEGSS